FSTFGECSGQVFSTPTPLEVLRTVKVSLFPPPCFFRTTPSNTWILSRFPSLIFPYPFTVSPTRNSGACAFICSSSIFLIMSFIVFSPFTLDVHNAFCNSGPSSFSHSIRYYTIYFRKNQGFFTKTTEAEPAQRSVGTRADNGRGLWNACSLRHPDRTGQCVRQGQNTVLVLGRFCFLSVLPLADTLPGSVRL